MDVDAKNRQNANKHIFISYSTQDKDTVYKISASLQKAGFAVWIDINDMGSHLLESIAKAVEEAWVVLICMSSGYNNSKYCKTEAEYTFQKNGECIFLRMRQELKPDGWLGALLGAKRYYDFSEPDKYDEIIQILQKELARKREKVFQKQENVELSAGKWKLGDKLDRNKNCSVFHVNDMNNEQTKEFAAKEAFISDDVDSTSLEEIDNEILVLKQLNHFRIVTFYGSLRTEKAFYLFLSNMAMGSLDKFIAAQTDGHLDEDKTAQFTYQILDGLQYLHSKKIIHRNIKGSNILLADENNIKISEFGVAKILDTLSRANTKGKGTVYWMAPERFQGVGYDYKVDIWSLGCTVFQMISGNIPFQNVKESDIIDSEGANLILTAPDTCSENLKNFLNQACERNQDKRPSASDLIKHAFVQDSWIHDLPKEILEKKLNESIASELGKTLGNKWESVMLELGINTVDIEAEKKNQHLTTICNLIMKWRQINDDKANYYNLLKALLKAEKEHKSTIDWDKVKESLFQK